MVVDNEQFFLICNQFDLKVTEKQCDLFLKRYQSFIQRTEKYEYLQRIMKVIDELLIVTASAKNNDWKIKKPSIGVYNRSRKGLSSIFDMFYVLALDFKKLVNYFIRDRGFSIFAIENENGVLRLLEIPLKYLNEDKLNDENLLIPYVNIKTLDKYKYSDDIIFFLYFWAKYGGDVRFSETSQFTLFLSSCFELVKNKNFSIKTLEGKFTAMKLPSKRNVLIKNFRVGI